MPQDYLPYEEQPRPWARLLQSFHMLWFVMALGFGGTSVAGFAFLNYTLERPPGLKGLLDLETMATLAPNMGPFYEGVFTYLKFHIAGFALLHLLSLTFTFAVFIAWRRRWPQRYRAIAEDATRSALTIAPALALGMSFNVLLVTGYVYVDWVREHMQLLMPYAVGAWSLIWLYTVGIALKIESALLRQSFDVDRMHFGWLLIPFALAMVAVSGAGIAALAHDPSLAQLAFFLSLVPFTMAFFLTSVKLFALFKAHYQVGLPEKMEFLPSFLMVLPIVTLISISLFRYGHYLDHEFGLGLTKAYYALVTAGGWAFSFWYLILGVILLADYFRNYAFDKTHFDESQWAFICPMVAFAVLGAFVYHTLLSHDIVIWLIIGFLVLDLVVLGTLMKRQVTKILGCCRENGTLALQGNH